MGIFDTSSSVINFYPRPPRGGRLTDEHSQRGGWRISIHALREEGDHRNLRFTIRQQISIHALREEGDDDRRAVVKKQIIFLSTPSARRATAKTEKNISAFVSL